MYSVCILIHVCMYVWMYVCMYVIVYQCVYVSVKSQKFYVNWLCTEHECNRRCNWRLMTTKYDALAKCKSVWKPNANLPDTLVALTSASKYFQILPAPPGTLQSALRLCKTILRCSWKHLQLWRSIQDAMRLTTRIVKFWSCWDLCTGLGETSRAAEISVWALRENSAQVCSRLLEQLDLFESSAGDFVPQSGL